MENNRFDKSYYAIFNYFNPPLKNKDVASKKTVELLFVESF